MVPRHPTKSPGFPPKGELFIAREENIGWNARSSILSGPRALREEVRLPAVTWEKGADGCLSCCS